MALAYVPPHLRGGASCVNHRSLQDVGGGYWNVELVYMAREPWYLEDCPLEVSMTGGCSVSNSSCSDAFDEPELQIHRAELLFPSTADAEIVSELLEWLAELARRDPEEDSWAQLVFPTELSKSDRAQWHEESKIHHLFSFSEGFADERRLVVSSQPPSKIKLNPIQEVKARQVFEWCQTEGGEFWQFSYREVCGLVAADQPFPKRLQQLVDHRCRAAELADCLRVETLDAARAIEILLKRPKTAFVKDPVSGSYPLNMACQNGLYDVAKTILEAPGMAGTLQLEDSQRRKPLQIARSKGHPQLVRLLQEAQERSPARGSFQAFQSDLPASPSDESPSARKLKVYVNGDASGAEGPPGFFAVDDGNQSTKSTPRTKRRSSSSSSSGGNGAYGQPEYIACGFRSDHPAAYKSSNSPASKGRAPAARKPSDDKWKHDMFDRCGSDVSCASNRHATGRQSHHDDYDACGSDQDDTSYWGRSRNRSQRKQGSQEGQYRNRTGNGRSGKGVRR